MIRSFYIAGTAMATQADKLDVLTNNLTNVDTSGYKKDKLISRAFSDVLIERLNDPYVMSISNKLGYQNDGVHIDEVVTDFSQSGFDETARLSDLALEGAGFFVIETPEGNMYTRDGNFFVNADGDLVTSDGYYLAGENGHIRVGSGEFSVDSQGNVIVNGQTVNRISLAAFDDLAGLRKNEDNLYMNYTNQPVRRPADIQVKQGFLETSNVDTAEEMVRMMEVTRAFSFNQRVLTMVDQSLEKTVNEVGRV
jgi:flagellar basal-body rod protein FlgG